MKTLLTIFLLLAAEFVFAGTDIKGMRSWSAPDGTRLVFDISGPVSHKVFILDNPDRVVLDVKAVTLRADSFALKENRFVTAIRTGVRNGTDLRVVLDLKEKVAIKSFQLKPNGDYGHRLVVDLDEVTAAATPVPPVAVKSKPKAAEVPAVSVNTSEKSDKVSGTPSKPAVEVKPTASVKPAVAVKSVEPVIRGRDLIIAIDAGHGGEDPGARGARGTKEKRVVLAIAKRLKKLVDAEPGMKGVLVRKGDYYIPLRKRMTIARREKADFFVSIHADAFRDRRAHGSSVYVLSKSGASSEAASWLAKKENSADLVGGVSLEDKDDVLASVLLDLSQAATMQASHEVADKTLGNLRGLGPTHGSKVQKARFVVLKAPDMPSMLVETAFISNPEEEKKLRNAKYQQRVAKAILGGIRTYFHKMPPPDTWLAQKEKARKADRYVISAGDTLSEIASRHSVSLARLKDYNNLPSDRIRIGQVIKIPVEG